MVSPTETVSSHPIFNSNVKSSVGSKRWEHLLVPTSPEMSKLERTFTTAVVSALLPNELQVTECVILEARPMPNAPLSEQCPHCDYGPELFTVDSGTIPHSALLAIEDDTSLVVWKGSHKFMRPPMLVNHMYNVKDLGRGTTILLRKGDVIIWRGDLIHAGARYTESNLRLFVYAKQMGAAATVMGGGGKIEGYPAYPVRWTGYPRRQRTRSSDAGYRHRRRHR